MSFHKAASVNVPIEARQYMKQLVEQSMMRFFVAVKARESGQLFLKVIYIMLYIIYLHIITFIHMSCTHVLLHRFIITSHSYQLWK